MSEITRITRLLKQTFEGSPYCAPSLLHTLRDVPAEVAARSLIAPIASGRSWFT